MKNVSELTDFYYKNLFPTLEELEIQRKNLRYRIIIVGIIYTFIFMLILSGIPTASQGSGDFFAFALFAYIGLGGVLYKFLTKDYTDEFKIKVIKPLISAIDEKLNYSSSMHVPQKTFERSELFTATVDRLSGNDHVKGYIDGTKLEFSDLHAQKRHRNSKGKESWSTIFKGLFIVAEFNKNFIGKTVVLPDTAQSTFGDLIGGWLQSKNMGRNELVKMDDNEFEKEFVVYSTNQIEARYILSHSLMQRLLTFAKKSKHPVYISFIGDSIHMAIYYDKDLFEPSIFHSLLKYKIAMEYVSTLHLAIGIVDELKLNQKIWSKR
ncbi:MAG: Galanin [Helicobacteraceae bacterium CG2_30_36_10]|nr:MAG: Galanin [Helicobacteraceae bacterium CG2_30_36_10]